MAYGMDADNLCHVYSGELLSFIAKWAYVCCYKWFMSHDP